MSDLSRRLSEALAQRRATQTDLARALGLSRQAVGKWLNGTGEPSAENLRRAAQFLGVSYDWLATGNITSSVLEDVPLLGTAAGSTVGAIQIDASDMGFVARPPALFGVRDAYAIIVSGSSMVPEHNPGDLRYVSPNAEPVPGDTVIVQQRNHAGAPVEAYIKRLVRRGPEQIVVQQHEPPATLTFRRARVEIHKVLSTREMFRLPDHPKITSRR